VKHLVDDCRRSFAAELQAFANPILGALLRESRGFAQEPGTPGDILDIPMPDSDAPLMQTGPRWLARFPKYPSAQ
jgi:hypothetical protein